MSCISALVYKLILMVWSKQILFSKNKSATDTSYELDYQSLKQKFRPTYLPRPSSLSFKRIT